MGWPLAGVNEPSEVIAADHLAQRSFWVHADDPGARSIKLPGAPYRFAEGGWSLRHLAPRLGAHDAEVAAELSQPAAADRGKPPARAVSDRVPSPSSPPLRGIRVIDVTTVWSGPFATMLLADLGAEVIRVENPWILPPTTKGYQARPTILDPGFLGSLYGDPVPDRPDRPWNRHAMNNAIARNKLSCTIDNRRPEGRELLMRLLECSDVFIENFRTSGLPHIGLYTSELQARNPRLVIVRMPPTGLTGDWSDYTGFGAQFDGLTGMAWLCGHRDTELVTTPGTTYMDAASGPAAAFATVAALRYRAQTGRGQLVEVDQSENILNHLGDIFIDCQLGVEPRRWGNRDRWRAPQGLYRCRGGEEWLAISIADDAAWRALTEVMGRGISAGTLGSLICPGVRSTTTSWTGSLVPGRRSSRRTRPFTTSSGPGSPPVRFSTTKHSPGIRISRSVHGNVRCTVSTWARTCTRGWRTAAFPRSGDGGRRSSGRTTSTSTRRCSASRTWTSSAYREEKILADDYLDRDGEPY